MVYLDKTTKTFRYHDAVSKLLEAKIKMTDEELGALKKQGGEADSGVIKFYFCELPESVSADPKYIFLSIPVTFLQHILLQTAT